MPSNGKKPEISRDFDDKPLNGQPKPKKLKAEPKPKKSPKGDQKKDTPKKPAEKKAPKLKDKKPKDKLKKSGDKRQRPGTISLTSTYKYCTKQESSILIFDSSRQLGGRLSWATFEEKESY